MKKTSLLLFTLFLLKTMVGQKLPTFELSDEWQAKIEKLSPNEVRIKTVKKNKVLVFSLHTGYQHWVIPHTAAVIRIIGEKSQAFEITASYDIATFSKKNLKKYDAIILNNTCSIGDKRNLFWDALKEDTSLTDAQRLKRAKKLERNLLKYVKKGKRLVILHGGILLPL